MSTQALRAATAAAKEPQSFPELLERMKPEISRALPKHLNADRMCRIALTEFRKTPKLGDCNLRTVFGAIITLSQLGLEPGVLGQAWLIPYGKECQGIPGWQGFVDLVARGGRASVWTGAVFAGDEFDYALGDRPFIAHKPAETGELPTPDRLTHCYAVGRVKGAEWPVIEVWSVPKIKAHRDRFNKVGSRHYSFQHFEMYGRKVPLLQVIKYMPKSVELQMAMDLENAAEAGQTIDMAEATSGSWIPPGEPEGNSGGDTKEGGENTGKGAAGYTRVYTDATAAAKYREATTLSALEGTRQAILADYAAAGVSQPLEVDGAYSDKKAALEQEANRL